MRGSIGGERVLLLVDSGSTHNFLDSSIVRKAKLKVDTTQKLKVQVANGELVTSEGACTATTLRLQGNQFTTSFYLLTLGGC
ncbi:retroviral-like aspartic protease, partial [Salmonella sp. gx-f5]|nr:retroviral-like aspartic protease [Salmonella sp. gx-f5]